MRQTFGVLGAAFFAALTTAAHAYTAAGDRIFPATIVLPQVAPSDDAYLTSSTQPLHSATMPGGTDRLTNFSGTYDKTLTENLSVGFTEGWNRFDQSGAGTASGFQNLETMFQYQPIVDPLHELVVSIGGAREWGGSGAAGVGAAASGATSAALYVGKGMGDLAPGWLRPFAVTANVSYAVADNNTRPDQLQMGAAIEYSIPYYTSKVASTALPDFVRNITPMVEVSFTTPPSSTRGATTSGTVAPGFNYAAEGWELGVEMLIPATRSAGNGLGVTAQIHVALDYLFPETLGRPLFSRH